MRSKVSTLTRLPVRDSKVWGPINSVAFRVMSTWTFAPCFTRAEAKPAENVPAAPAAEEKIDFSNVQIEPLFADFVDFDTFSKSDFRAVKVKACEAVKKSKKLLKFTLDDGTGKDRTVASGIAKWYAPEDLVGKKVVVVANLKPAVLCGVESNGMILAADCSEDDVKVVFVDKSMPNGSKIR